MVIRILKVETNEQVEAHIKESEKRQLPSLHEGWRFNFSKHAKAKGAQTYVLVTEETPNIIEGCLIYKMMDDTQLIWHILKLLLTIKGRTGGMILLRDA